MYGRLDYTHALCAESPVSDAKFEIENTWILYESHDWKELTQALSFDKLPSLEYFARHSGYAHATSQRLKSKAYSLTEDTVVCFLQNSCKRNFIGDFCFFLFFFNFPSLPSY